MTTYEVVVLVVLYLMVGYFWNDVVQSYFKTRPTIVATALRIIFWPVYALRVTIRTITNTKEK